MSRKPEISNYNSDDAFLRALRERAKGANFSVASLAGAAGMLPKPMAWDEVRRIVREERAMERIARWMRQS